MRNSHHYLLSLLCLLLSMSASMLAAQDGKTRARLDVAYFNTAVNERYLTIKVTTRIDRRNQGVEGAQVNVHLHTSADSIELGSIITDGEGLGTFVLPPSFYKAVDTLPKFTFFCSLTDHPQVLDRDRELSIQEIEIKTDFIDQDTLKWIRATLLEPVSPGVQVPIEGVEIQFFVVRPFNLLAISEPMETDSEGEATIQFPLDLPGDATGHVMSVVKIDDSDEYGTIEKRETVQWGVPTVFDDDSIKRSLWAAGANAPIYLLLLTNGLIAVTWGIIFYIIYQIFRISKL